MTVCVCVCVCMCVCAAHLNFSMFWYRCRAARLLTLTCRHTNLAPKFSTIARHACREEAGWCGWVM